MASVPILRHQKARNRDQEFSDVIQQTPLIRNFAIIGKTGVGKSSIARLITGSNIFMPVGGFENGNRNIIDATTDTRTPDGSLYKFYCVDTAGLLDRGSTTKAVKANLHTAYQFVTTRITSLNAIVLVIKRERLLDVDMKMLDTIQGSFFFPDYASFLIVVITRCKDKESVSAKQDLQARHPLFRNLSPENVITCDIADVSSLDDDEVEVAMAKQRLYKAQLVACICAMHNSVSVDTVLQDVNSCC